MREFTEISEEFNSVGISVQRAMMTKNKELSELAVLQKIDKLQRQIDTAEKISTQITHLRDGYFQQMHWQKLSESIKCWKQIQWLRVMTALDVGNQGDLPGISSGVPIDPCIYELLATLAPRQDGVLFGKLD